MSYIRKAPSSPLSPLRLRPPFIGIDGIPISLKQLLIGLNEAPKPVDLRVEELQACIERRILSVVVNTPLRDPLVSLLYLLHEVPDLFVETGNRIPVDYWNSPKCCRFWNGHAGEIFGILADYFVAEHVNYAVFARRPRSGNTPELWRATFCPCQPNPWHQGKD